MRKRARGLKESRDLAEIARRTRAGDRTADIGESLGLSPRQVRQGLASLAEAWNKQREPDREELFGRDLAVLDLLELELWAAFAVSQEPRVVTRTTVREGWSAFRRVSTRTENRAGSPTILDLIRECSALRSELLGLLRVSDGRTGSGPLPPGVSPLAGVEMRLIVAELEARYQAVEVWAPDQPSFPPFDPPPGGEDPESEWED